MRRWAINIATSYARFVVAIAVVYFLTPYIIAEIGIDKYGLWALVLAITGMLGLLDFATQSLLLVEEDLKRCLLLPRPASRGSARGWGWGDALE